MNHPRIRLVLLLALGAGCSPSSEEVPPASRPRVPARGTVRLDGKPLVGAVVVFLPIDQEGTLTQGETGEDGSYELLYTLFPGGTAPGRYKVGISYLVTPSGKTIGLGPRTSFGPGPEMRSAKERLPDKYSNLGKTELTAVVPPQGGTFDFDLDGPLLPPADPVPSAGDTAPPAEDSS